MDGFQLMKLMPNWAGKMLIQYSRAAITDLKRIRSYISAHWGENTAKNIMKAIKSDIKRLEQYPASGYSLGKIIDSPTEYRCLFSEKNYVFYHLESDKIHIVRVINEQQNFMELLAGIRSDHQ